MWYNLKIALRNLWRNGLYTWINIGGLAVSLTVCILLTLWVQDELSYDKINKKAENIFAVNAKVGGDDYWAVTPAPLAIHAKAEFPEIREACRIGGYSKGYFEYEGQKYHRLGGSAVDSSFFRIFDFSLLEGNPEKPFTDEMSMIVTETLAKTIFGDENPIGKTLRANDDMLFHITGIVAEPPKNSSIRFNYLVPFDVQQKTFPGNGEWEYINEDWGGYSYRTYFLLQEGADVHSVETKVSDLVTGLRGRSDRYYFTLQPLLKIHLYGPDGEPQGMKTIRLFVIITALILIIACINYVNLVTARAAKRSREIAMRKILGSDKKKIFLQLIRETFLLLIPTFIIATVLIYILMPMYNQLAGKEMVFSFTNGHVWLIYGIMLVSILLLAGVYPAFFLSSFRPLEAFRVRSSGKKGGAFLRKMLVVLQFVCSFGLIVATITIALQMKYMREKDLGYDQEYVYAFWAGQIAAHYNAVKTELLNNKDILGVTATDHMSMMIGSSRYGADWQGKPEDLDPVFYQAYIQSNFFEVMDIELLEGRTPSPQDTFVLYINKEAARVMGMDDPVGKPFYFNKGEEFFVPITGVVGDYNFQSLNEPIKPLLLIVHPAISHAVYVKTTGNGAKGALKTTEELWKQYNPDYEFSYTFLDETFDWIYNSEIRVGKILMILAITAIFISCLGIFGLITYTAETKHKEIGIRKVMGARVINIINMLSREFLILIGIAMVIAVPVSYYWLHGMLLDYDYRIPVYWWIFALAAVITVALTLLTVGFQAYKAATANPVDSIKTE